MKKQTAIKLHVEVGADHTIRLPDEVPLGPAEVIVLSRVAPEQTAAVEPHFKTQMARELWEQRLKIEGEGHGSLDADGIDAEVASRRGGKQATR